MTENVQSKNRAEQSTGTSTGLERRQGDTSLFGADPFWSPQEFFSASPFSLMRRFTENMERAFQGWGTGQDRERLGMWSPAVDVSQRDNNLIVHADLPGLKNDDVKVEVENNVLVIQGERKQESRQNEGGYRRTERRYGSFYRAIPLPEGAQTDRARAEFRDGVLEVSVPVPASQNRARQIPIQSGGSPARRESSAAGSTSTEEPKVSRAGEKLG